MRGAVLVLGVLAGAVLTAALSQLVSTAVAITEREATQHAADAAAFGNAVWHARGMNLIAGLNILMALVQSVLVIWRLALVGLALSLFAVGPSADASTSSPPADGVDTVAVIDMVRDDERVATEVQQLLAGLGAAQTAVAVFTPVLAATTAAAVAEKTYGVSAATASGSLLALQDYPASGLRSERGSTGLPVEHAQPGLLCSKAQGYATRERHHSVGLLASHVGTGARGQFGILQALCQPNGETFRRFKHEVSAGLAKPNGESNASQDFAPQDRVDTLGRLLTAPLGTPIESAAPARVASHVSNGSIHFRSVALAISDLHRPVETAFEDETESGTGRAQAEVYFDCNEEWHECEANALWQMRWRARLRRARSFSGAEHGSTHAGTALEELSVVHEATGGPVLSAKVLAHPLRPLRDTPQFQAMLRRSSKGKDSALHQFIRDRALFTEVY